MKIEEMKIARDQAKRDLEALDFQVTAARKRIDEWEQRIARAERRVEQWRPFREGTYEVSSLGNIRRAKPGTSTFVGRPVMSIVGAGGYPRIDLNNRGVRRFYVHRLVAEVFLGACPDGYVVNHRDGNRANNAVGNLEYVTPSENSQHAKSLPRRRGPTKPRAPKKGLPRGDQHWTKRMPERISRGERHGSKLTEAVVRDVKRRLASGERQRDLAAEVGISIAQVSRIARGQRWGHVPHGGQQ